MGQYKQEQEFEEYLDGESTLSTAYRQASSEQAPAHMDDAILAASRRAVKSKPRYAFSPFAADWHIPLSLAAVLVLSVSVIVTMQNDSDEKSPGSGKYHPRTKPSVAEEGLSDITPRTKSLAVKEYVNKKRVSPPAQADSSSTNTAAVAAPSVMMERQMEISGQPDKIMMEEEIVNPARQMQADLSDRPAPSGPVEHSYAPVPKDVQLLREQQKIINSEGRAGQLRNGKQRPKQNFSVNKKSAKANTVDESSTENLMAMPRQSPADALYYPAAGVAADQQSPEIWLEYIAQLWADGDSKRALQQLQLFYKRYPDYDRAKLGNMLEHDLMEAAGINQ